MSPMVSGLIQFNADRTGFDFNILALKYAISKIIINDGSTTPKVARIDPKKPY